MRLWELIFLGLLTAGALLPPARRSYRWGVAAAVTAAGALHWALEGTRWQLTPAYLWGALWIVWTALGWAIPATRLARLAALAPTLLALALGRLFPVVALGALPGDYAVGTATFHLIDESRPELYGANPGRGARELMLQIWYPADAPTADAPVTTAPYLDRPAIGGPAIMRALRLPTFLLNHVGLITTHALVNAPLPAEQATYPVLLFSHGLKGVRGQNSQQIEALVSAGYIVAAVDHAYAAAYTVFPNGRVIAYTDDVIAWDTPEETASIRRLAEVWAGDLAAVLRTLDGFNQDLNSPFFQRLNLEQLGVFGHSTGGGATVMFCAQEERCRAALLLDPWMVPVAERPIASGIPQPVMILRSPEPISAPNDILMATFYRNLPGPAYWAVVEGSAHYDFSDFPALSPLLRWIGMTGSVGHRQGQAILYAYAKAFFDYHLRGWSGALLFAESADFPEVRLNRK